MPTPDVALVSPFPGLGERRGGWTGVAPYAASLAEALTGAGARVTVLGEADGLGPAVERSGPLELRRVWRRGPAALPKAAAAARATGAPAVHLQHELFLYGGPEAALGVVPALAALRGRRRVVTMHHVVDPGAVDAEFCRTHRVRVPAPAARAAVTALQRGVRAVADEVVVLEPAFASVVPGSTVLPHGVEAPAPPDRDAARAALGVPGDRLCVLCFGFISPYKGLEPALEAAGLAGPGVELVVAGGEHPRLAAAGDPYAARLRAAAPPNVRFTGYVPDADVARWFAAADVLLLPYPRPFATSGPLALALAHGTPVLLSPALAATMGATDELVAALDPPALAARLAGLRDDAEDRAKLRERTRELAAGRAWPKVAERHLELYGRAEVVA